MREVQVHTAAASLIGQQRAASALSTAGVVAGDRIVLAVPGSAAYVDVVLGATRSGVVPVPLDPRLTRFERDAIIADVDPVLVVTSDDQLAALLEEGPSCHDLAPWPRCRPMHFTSGTTGRPKGVWSGLLSPEHARALALEERELWGFKADDVNLVVSPVYHSAPLRFACGTLLAGGSIAVLPGFDAETFSDVVEQTAPTSMFCVPAHLQRLFAYLDETGRDLDTSSFRVVAHAGAPCPEPVRLRAHEQFGSDIVWEFYGSTEGQFTSCSAEQWRDHPGTVGPVRAGRTITIDEDGLIWCTVPPWARFEYWNDPVKTAAAWRDTPEGPAFTVRDLGRIDDGYVYLDSRREDLIVSGGVNVYPAEVEAAFEDLSGVVEIAVFGRPDERWGQRVCATYVGTATPEDLRARAEERLAPPKRPKTWERVDALPRTATGKVRRTELR